MVVNRNNCMIYHGGSNSIFQPSIAEEKPQTHRSALSPARIYKVIGIGCGIFSNTLYIVRDLCLFILDLDWGVTAAYKMIEWLLYGVSLNYMPEHCNLYSELTIWLKIDLFFFWYLILGHSLCKSNFLSWILVFF